MFGALLGLPTFLICLKAFRFCLYALSLSVSARFIRLPEIRVSHFFGKNPASQCHVFILATCL